ncbi:HNH endonuclease signature motif containing protein [Blastococcus capsensis]|uniref:HNH endonuclease signature motif containing protein n=1 Tax=Blastococcus capsensis TaxID=1564163 RepID=UPI00253F9C3A|nr:HNH endonuclease signature motif containing protein [Blastococcus capsensis]MDK3255952.1 DUF222 domain-containing protein [Blastococcus capsensis]
MADADAVSDWYTTARARAVAAGRRRRAAEASTEWPEFTPPVGLAGGPLGAVQAADREFARQTALRARAVATFAADRPADGDRAQGEPGAMSPERWAARPEVLRGVSEWATQELVIALSVSAEAAQKELTRSVTLVERLPGTLAALEAGALHPGHLWSMLEKVAPIADDRVRAEVEAELLRWAAGRVVTPAQLNDKARREVIRRDARAAARNLQKALRERGITIRPGTVEGMAALTVVTTLPEAQALYRALAACAETLDGDDDPRTRGQKMVDCLLDLVLRPGETDLPPVQVLLTVVASLATLAGGDGPGEIDGQLVPAEMVRQFLGALTGRQAGSDGADPARQQPPGSMSWQEEEQAELERWLAETERRLLSGELVDPDPDGNGDLALLPDVGDDLHGDIAPTCDLPPNHEPEVGLEVARTDAGTDATAAPGRGRRNAPPQASAGPGERHGDPPVPPPDGISPDADNPPEETPTPAGPVPAGPIPPGPAATAPGTGWWMLADEAVEAAGLAVLRAQQELSRARRLVRTAATADAADEADWQAGPGGRLTGAEDSLAALRSASETHRAWLADLLESTGGGGLADRPRIALTDALSGTLLALTDLPRLRRTGSCGRSACRRDAGRCGHDLSDRPGLGAPGPSTGYRPSAELDRWVRARDRRCRFPGCRRRVPRGGELDHHRPYPAGPTSAGNLVGYCTTDHRGKHQAPGWRHDLGTDGTLTVTTPSGLVATTSPPPY